MSGWSAKAALAALDAKATVTTVTAATTAAASGRRRAHLDPAALTEEVVFLFREAAHRKPHSVRSDPLKFLFLLCAVAAPILAWTLLFSALGKGVAVNVALTARKGLADALMALGLLIFCAAYVLDARFWRRAALRLLRAALLAAAVGGLAVAMVLSVRDYPITPVVCLFLAGLPYCCLLYATVSVRSLATYD